MAEINKFSMYSLGNEASGMSQKDIVDQMVDEMIDLHMYQDVQDFVKKNFGEYECADWFYYPELNKKIYVKSKEELVEIVVYKNDKRYYGKGWKKIKNN